MNVLDLFSGICIEFWGTLSEMAPYLLFGFFIAGVLSVWIRPEKVERHLGGRGFGAILKATLLGIPLPLCSCSVIPVGASLRRHGAGKGATTAFLLSTPQTGVDSIAVTLSLLGPGFAVFRPLAALITGVVGGLLTSLFPGSDKRDEEDTSVCSDSCCSGEAQGSAFIRVLRYGFVTLPRDIGRSLLVGLLLAGLIAAVIPNDYFSSTFGSGIFGMFVMMLLGIPVYVCATASVPVAAALITKGVSAGAALVFLVTGPATNAAAITTIWKIMGKRTVFIYLLTVAVTAFGFGLLLDAIYLATDRSVAPGMHRVLPASVENVSAVILLAVLAVAAFYRPNTSDKPAHDVGSERASFKISGMTCSHCAQNVKRSLRECDGVESVQVDLRTGIAVIHGSGFDAQRLYNVVEQLGYTTTQGDQSNSKHRE